MQPQQMYSEPRRHCSSCSSSDVVGPWWKGDVFSHEAVGKCSHEWRQPAKQKKERAVTGGISSSSMQKQQQGHCIGVWGMHKRNFS